MTSCRNILTGLYEKVVQGIKVLDSEGTQINPATEESLTALIDLMNFSALKRKEVRTNANLANGKITFSQSMNGVEMYNNSSSNTLTYTINGIGITLNAGDSDQGIYDEFTEVTISGTSPAFVIIGCKP